MDHHQITAVMADALGFPVRYEPVDIPAFTAAMTASGRPEHLVQHLTSIAADYQNGVFAGTSNAVTAITGRPPVTVAEYVRAHRERFTAPARTPETPVATGKPMSHHTTMREALRDLLLSPGTDVADAMNRHFDPAYTHSINETWSTRAQYAAQIAQVRATLSHGTIEVHQELRQGTTYAERHTLELATADGSKQRLEVFIFGEYAPDGRFFRLHEAVFSPAAGPGQHG